MASCCGTLVYRRFGKSAVFIVKAKTKVRKMALQRDLNFDVLPCLLYATRERREFFTTSWLPKSSIVARPLCLEYRHSLVHRNVGKPDHHNTTSSPNKGKTFTCLFYIQHSSDPHAVNYS